MISPIFLLEYEIPMYERVLGTIDRYGLRDYVFLREEFPQVYTTPDDVMQSYPVDRSFIDQSELQKEASQLSSSLRLALQRQSGTAIGFGSQREASRWTALEERIQDLIAIAAVQNRVVSEIEEGNPSSRTYLEIALYHCGTLGVELTLRSALKDQLALANKTGVGDYFTEYARLVDFSNGYLTAIKIDGVALADFIDPKIAKKSPVLYFQYLTLAEMSAYHLFYNQVVDDNQGTVAAEFPNHTKWNVNVLSTKVSLLMGYIEAGIIKGQAISVRSPLDDVYRAAARIIEGVHAVRNKTRKVLLNPKDPDSIAIREIAGVFLKSPLLDERIHILQILGLNKISELFSTYRQAYQLASSDGGEFYLDLVMEIRDFIEEISSSRDILNDDDIGFFLKGDTDVLQSSSPEEEITSQGRFINEITSQTSQRLFEINPAILDLGNLAEPQLIEVNLDGNRPRKFTINLVYNNELDEEVEIVYAIDTTKQAFDWNFLEDPANPENARITTMRNQLIRLASTLLSTIAQQEDEKKRFRNTPKALREEQTTSVKRERNDDPIYALRKQVRAELRSAGAEDSGEIDIMPALEKGKVKNIIDLDSNELTRRVHVGVEDAQNVFGSIRDYNERGVGEFNRKRKRGSDGKPRYTLRAGNLRVLARETSSERGIRRFEILDIRNRKDVYSKNEL